MAQRLEGSKGSELFIMIPHGSPYYDSNLV